MTNPHPRIIYGGSTIGEAYNTVESVVDLLQNLKSHNIDQIDTAALYPFINPGQSEILLGKAGASKQGFKIDTKILVTSKDANGTLEPSKINKSVTTSSERLQYEPGDFLNIVHCHAPDVTTPLKDQAAALDALHKRGKFQQLGVSNFPVEMLNEFIEVSEREGYVKPTVYQGLYNLLSRGHEQLFPTLRKHNIIFNAHSPVASGFLSGKLTSGNIDGTRFSKNNASSAAIKAHYDKKELHDAIHTLNSIIEPVGISSIEVALRWICYHSQLTAEDGIILGATKPQYIEENIRSIEKGPLEEEMVIAIEKIWDSLSK